MPSGRDDILNMAIGRPEHPGRVHGAGTGVTITRYFGPASRRSTSSSNSITVEQLADIIGNLKEEWQRQAEQENIKREEVWMRRIEEEKSPPFYAKINSRRHGRGRQYRVTRSDRG